MQAKVRLALGPSAAVAVVAVDPALVALVVGHHADDMAYIIQNIWDTLARAQAVTTRASGALATVEEALDDTNEDR
jgi:hypothetical protein